MVAELEVELGQMRGRLEQAERTLLEQVTTLNKAEEERNKLEETVEQNRQAHTTTLNSLNDKVQEIEDIMAKMEDSINPKMSELQGAIDGITNDAQRRFKEDADRVNDLVEGAANKFTETDGKFNILYSQTDARLRELSDELKRLEGQGGGAQGYNHKKTGLLPDKMMVPKTFDSDILQWNKWKEGVMKYFDESREGIKKVMEEVARYKDPVTAEVLRETARSYPEVLSSVEQWKHLYRALEKLTEGEASKVLSTVKDENGFEAWRQLHLRFEPELEAQKNVVMMDLHNIPQAKTIDETRTKMVELKVRIAKAETILHIDLQELQKMTALMQIIDPTTRMHTAMLGLKTFDDFYARAMMFANTIRSRWQRYRSCEKCR